MKIPLIEQTTSPGVAEQRVAISAGILWIEKKKLS
jgi:hypothetical protein